MTNKNLNICNIPAILYGDKTDKVWVFVHGKCGYKEEALSFANIVCQKGYQVLSFDLPEHGERKCDLGFDPFHAIPDINKIFSFTNDNFQSFSLRANSIGAWFSILSTGIHKPQKALFVSPILDMNKLINNMMMRAGISLKELTERKEITTEFGETLFIDYLLFAKNNPISNWDVDTRILYAGGDNLTDRDTVNAFCNQFHCRLSIMKDGEHWFHTPKQIAFLKKWENDNV